MAPVQEFFGGKLSIIRPLYMMDQEMIRRYAEGMGRPDISLGCPTAGASKREEIKAMLRRLYASKNKVKGNIFQALRNVRQGYLL